MNEWYFVNPTSSLFASSLENLKSLQNVVKLCIIVWVASLSKTKSSASKRGNASVSRVYQKLKKKNIKKH